MPRNCKVAGNAHRRASNLKNVFDPACLAARDCTYVEETMKQLCVGIVVALA
jgi:hypothetical protein